MFLEGLAMNTEGSVAERLYLAQVAGIPPRAERAALVIFGHGSEQWQTLKKLTAYYE
jgi:hypothetical protein